MKNILIFLGLTVLIFSCKNQSPQQAESTENIQVSIHDILIDTESYIGKSLSIEGTVDHVCKHGGRKLFVFGESPEDRIKIIPDDKMSSFKPELEGSDIAIRGILIEELKVDEEYIAQMENNIGSSKLTGEELESEKRQIDNLKKELKACDNDHLSFYAIKCSELKEIK